MYMKVSLSQENKFLQSRWGWGEFCTGLAASDADSSVLSFELVVTFPAKENLSASTQCL